MGNVAATFRSACARLKAASTPIRLSSYFTDTTLAQIVPAAIYVLSSGRNSGSPWSITVLFINNLTA
jgi:hypothetical protein